jgi:hypothetical protein
MKNWIFITLWLMASGSVWAQGIFTCTDAKGRKLTSDRPIAECNDRDQRELNSSGTVKRTVKPVMTLAEQREQETKDKLEVERQIKLAENKRKDRAMMNRYPNRASHDKERAVALQRIDDVTMAAKARIDSLAKQRVAMDAEFDKYKNDPSKMPQTLRRQMDDNLQNVSAQKRFIVDQENEKKRTNMRFDEELNYLQTLWSGSAASAAETAPPAANNPAVAAPIKK